MASPSTPAPRSELPLIPANQRPSRALIGWLPREHAISVLARHNNDRDAVADRVDRAYSAVAQRERELGQENAVSPVDPQVDAIIGAQLADPRMAPFVSEGWQPRIVDLRKVVSLQPTVSTDGWNTEISFGAQAAMADIVEVTVPPPDRTPLFRWSQVGNSFCVQSPNPNLRVVTSAVDPDNGVFGFVVQCSLSVMQVVNVGNRLLLRDGYNRAYALLRRGIHLVPCLYREWPAQQDLGVPAGMIAPSVYLGERPPRLPDFLDDEVAADTYAATARKLVLIHAVETIVE